MQVGRIIFLERAEETQSAGSRGSDEGGRVRQRVRLHSASVAH